jgi:hypothetical protein
MIQGWRLGSGNCIKVFRRKYLHGELKSGKRKVVSFKIMGKPPSHPTSLRPEGITIFLPRPTLIIDSMEQKAYRTRKIAKGEGTGEGGV